MRKVYVPWFSSRFMHNYGFEIVFVGRDWPNDPQKLLILLPCFSQKKVHIFSAIKCKVNIEVTLQLNCVFVWDFVIFTSVVNVDLPSCRTLSNRQMPLLLNLKLFRPLHELVIKTSHDNGNYKSIYLCKQLSILLSMWKPIMGQNQASIIWDVVVIRNCLIRNVPVRLY